jgi:hypothetical protein
MYANMWTAMGIRLYLRGNHIECDSAEEAIALLQRIGGIGTATFVRYLAWTDTTAKNFLRALTGSQVKLIEELVAHPKGRTDQQLCKALGVRSGRQLAGVFAGLWKNARKVGADPNDVYHRDVTRIGNRRRYEYTLAPALIEAVLRAREPSAGMRSK